MRAESGDGVRQDVRVIVFVVYVAVRRLAQLVVLLTNTRSRNSAVMCSIRAITRTVFSAKDRASLRGLQRVKGRCGCR
jgi:hypothetical protein